MRWHHPGCSLESTHSWWRGPWWRRCCPHWADRSKGRSPSGWTAGPTGRRRSSSLRWNQFRNISCSAVPTFLGDLTDSPPGRVVGYFLLIVEPEYELWWLRAVLGIQTLSYLPASFYKVYQTTDWSTWRTRWSPRFTVCCSSYVSSIIPGGQSSRHSKSPTRGITTKYPLRRRQLASVTYYVSRRVDQF